MAYSVTGTAYLTLLFTLGYLIYRFFQYWKKEKDAVSKQSLYFTSLFGLFVLISAIGGLFFADDPLFLKRTREVGVFIQAFAFAFMAYHIIYLRFPKVSPWWGFTPILILGLIAAILTITVVSFDPFLDPSGAINWGLPSSPIDVFVSLLRLFLFFVTFIPLIIILFSQFKNAEDPRVKGKALGMGFALLFILLAVSLDFLFIGFFGLNPIWRDMVFIVCSAIFLITLILTLPPSSSKIYASKF
jgi:hypothetical protein